MTDATPLTPEEIAEGRRLEAADRGAMTAASHVTLEHAAYVSWLREYGVRLLAAAERLAEVKRLLDGRDEFIVERGLWSEFVASRQPKELKP